MIWEIAIWIGVFLIAFFGLGAMYRSYKHKQEQRKKF